MNPRIITITTPFMLNVSVNCYLVRNEDGDILVDTGIPNKRGAVEKALEEAGCQPGDLKAILLTHGDKDHSGNAAYLRERFGCEIAMHADDAGMVERGDMFWNRKQPNRVLGMLFGRFLGLRKADRFKPDRFLQDGDDLSRYGWDARVLQIPGHSRGSIAFLTAEGNLFCGDLLGNINQPELWSLIDDPGAANASLEKLRALDIKTVYPGHGKPFEMERFVENKGWSEPSR